jgi:hypothetical protein
VTVSTFPDATATDIALVQNPMPDVQKVRRFAFHPLNPPPVCFEPSPPAPTTGPRLGCDWGVYPNLQISGDFPITVLPIIFSFFILTIEI